MSRSRPWCSSCPCLSWLRQQGTRMRQERKRLKVPVGVSASVLFLRNAERFLDLGADLVDRASGSIEPGAELRIVRLARAIQLLELFQFAQKGPVDVLRRAALKELVRRSV